MGVLTQYQPLVLNEYIGNGQPWDLDRLYGGVHVLPPYQTATGSDWYKGTANAIYQNINFIERYDPEYVLILSGDHIYKMDYAQDAGIPQGQQCRLHHRRAGGALGGGLPLRHHERPTRTASSPSSRRSRRSRRANLASMGIYIFTWEKLRKYLTEDEADPNIRQRLRQKHHSRPCWRTGERMCRLPL